MENYYYECIYERLQQAVPNAVIRTVLQKRKAEIVQFQSTRSQQLLANNNAAERTEGEQPTVYKVLQMRRRRNELTITALRDPECTTQTTPKDIARILSRYLRGKI